MQWRATRPLPRSFRNSLLHLADLKLSCSPAAITAFVTSVFPFFVLCMGDKVDPVQGDQRVIALIKAYHHKILGSMVAFKGSDLDGVSDASILMTSH